MVRGKRRDEWDRFSELLALVHNGLDWSGKSQRTAASFWPKYLLEGDESQSGRSNIPKISFDTMLKRALGEK